MKKEERKNTELKFVDVVNATSPTWSGTLITGDISAVGQGVGSSNRIGDVIRPRGLYFNCELVGNSSANSYNEFRYVIFQWKIDSAYRTPTPGDILQLVGSDQTPHSPYNFLQRDNFRVIKDKHMIIDATVDNTDKSTIAWKKYIKLDKIKPIKYDASGGPTGINKIYIMLFSDGLANVPTLKYYCRMTYTDA